MSSKDCNYIILLISVHSNFSCNGAKNYWQYNSIVNQAAQAANIMFAFMEYKEKIFGDKVSFVIIMSDSESDGIGNIG